MGRISWQAPEDLHLVERTNNTTLAYRIVVAFDKSGSMGIGEKMKIAHNATLDFFKQRKGDLVAVLPFSDSALFGEGTPFTTDRQYVEETTRLIGPGSSTAIGDGILGGLWLILRDIYVTKNMRVDGLAMPQFSDIIKSFDPENVDRQRVFQNQLGRQFGALDGSFIVLVTDGESNMGISPTLAVHFAIGMHLPVYVIKIEEEASKEIGEQVSRDVPEFVADLEAGGGAYFRATFPSDIERMYKKIDELRPTRVRTQTIVEQHSYRYELNIAILFLLLFAALVRGVYLVIE